MDLDKALLDMATEMDEKGCTGAEITRAGHIMGFMAAMLTNDTDAINHFLTKLAKPYGLKIQPL